MARRFLVGALLGVLLGALVAASIVFGLKTPVFEHDVGGVLYAYGGALLTGVIVGLAAGRPIWAGDAKVEGGLKAVFGALFSLGAMFALRTWAGGMAFDLRALDAGRGPIGDLPALALPLVAAVLAALLGADNTEEAPTPAKGAARARIAVSKGKAGAAVADDVAEEVQPSSTARRTR
jgi:hypothetical protein